MYYTNLVMVQKILSALESEEVNSVSDTTESLQVLEILEDIYYELISELDLTEVEGLLQLNASLDPTKPCVMHLPRYIKKLDWVQYDCKRDGETQANYKHIEKKSIDEFIRMMTSFRGAVGTFADTMTVTGPKGESFEFVYRTDKAPTYYCAMDNSTLIFDSIDLQVDTTLQKSKTMAFGSYFPEFEKTDVFTPNLNENQMMLMLNLAKSRAFTELKQMENMNAIRAARRQRIAAQWQANKNEERDSIQNAPRYGRRTR